MAIPSFWARQSVWKKWIFSYLIVLLIPFFISVALFSFARGAISEEIVRANRATLHYAINEIDATAETMRSALVSLIGDREISDLLQLEPDSVAFRSQLPYVSQSIATTTQATPQTQILLYLPEGDTVITRTTANPSALIYESMRHQNLIDLSYGEYLARLQAVSRQYKWSVSQGIVYTDGVGEYVTLSIALDAHSNIPVSKYPSTFFVMIKLTDFAASLLSREENGLLIYDENGSLLRSFNCTEPDGFSLPDVLKHNVQLSDSTGNFICSGAKSASCGWSFVLITPEARLYENVNRFWNIALIFFGAALLIGLCVIVLVVRRNYQPVQKVLSALGVSATRPSGQDEFELMQHTYADLYYRNQDLSQKLASRRETQRKNYLFALLHGNRPLLSDEDVQENVRLNLTGKAFAIAVFSLAHDVGADTLEAAAYSIGLLAQQPDTFLNCYIYFEDQLITCLFLADAKATEQASAQLAQLADHILIELKKALNISANAVIGDCCTDFNLLHDQFRLSMEAVQYQFVTHKKGLMPVSEFTGGIAPIPDRAEQEKLSLLCEAVASRKFGDAQAILQRLFDHIPVCSENGFAIDRFQAFSWAGTVANVGIKLWPQKSAAIQSALDQMIADKDSVALYETFCKLLRELCSEDNKPIQYSTPLSAKVEQYIMEHYSDCNLCLNSLSEIMTLSPKYLSQLFRSETGVGLLDFLNQVRVRAAKKLLSTGKHTVAEVSELVGYTNVKTFRRAFLKVEGCNPGQSGEKPEK